MYLDKVLEKILIGTEFSNFTVEFEKNLTIMIQNFHDLPRVIYDRVQKSKNYFEIPAFLPIELGISRAGKFKVMSH